MTWLFERLDNSRRIKSVFLYVPLFFIIELLVISQLFCSCRDSSNDSQSGTVNEKENGNTGSKLGQSLFIGNYEQNGITDDGPEGIKWKVIDETEDALLLLCDKAIDCIQYCSEFRTVSWTDSDIYSFLNGTFYNKAFGNNYEDFIIETEKGKLFLLSRTEFYKHYAAASIISISSDATSFGNESVCGFTEYADNKSVKFGPEKTEFWALRTDNESKLVFAVGKDGAISDFEINCTGLGLRPAMWIRKVLLESPTGFFFVSKQYEFYEGETFSFEDGEVFYDVIDGQPIPVVISELKNNLFTLHKAGDNVLKIETDSLIAEITVYAEPKPIKVYSISSENAVFKEGSAPNLDFSFTAIFRLSDETVAFINQESELLKQVTLLDTEPIRKDQTYITASFREFEFQIPITVN